MAAISSKVLTLGREWLLLVGIVAATLLIALALIRWFAPSLLGIRDDMQIVRVSKEIPPFFENVFQKEGQTVEGFLLQDPYTRVRARPLIPSGIGFGPHDLLGFRNRAIPNMVDVLTIGDSQTYGNNVQLEENWPSRLSANWKADVPVVYNISTGGWAAVQYLEMLGYALAFQPRVVVVAFYSGNDALESFMMAYSDNRYRALRSDPKLTKSDLPPGRVFPAPKEDLWTASFKDGFKMTFSPKHRLSSNDTKFPAVRAGYAIMDDVAQRIVASARSHGIAVVLTIIPTKELVYAERIRRAGIDASEDYVRLVAVETANIAKLSDSLRDIYGAMYVDVVVPLQAAALRERALYPSSENGHPLAAGYRVIADTIAPAVKGLLPPPTRGLIALKASVGRRHIVLATAGGVWNFASETVLQANGWKIGMAREARQRDIEHLPFRGTINIADPMRYGPAAIR